MSGYESADINFIEHLLDLRARLVRCVFSVALLFSILFYYSSELYALLARPLLKLLPHGQTMIAVGVTGPLVAPIKLSFVLAIFFAIPYIFHQMWLFIAPGLYKQERRFVWPLTMVSIILFYVGVAFAYCVVFPLVFAFLIHMAPVGVAISPDIQQFLDFSLQLFFAFGFVFQVPIVIIFLAWIGVVSIEQLINIRPYMIVLAFIIGMLLTPPDVLSQVLLAVPFCLLYELGLQVAKIIVINRNN